MQRVLKILQRWYRVRGLSVSPEKMELMLFTSRKEVHRNCSARNGNRSYHVLEVSGVILDTTMLTWKEHLKQRFGTLSSGYVVDPL
jgi:hypothetical protein